MAKLFNSKGLTFITSNFYQLINFNNAIKNLQEPSNRPQNRKPGPANPNPVQKHKKPGPPHQRNTPLAIFLNKSIKTYKTLLFCFFSCSFAFLKKPEKTVIINFARIKVLKNNKNKNKSILKFGDQTQSIKSIRPTQYCFSCCRSFSC